ncbi:MAG: hypothetical protein QG597_4617 [Actinomycetota bacterium]|nr:hypothetical protein [Actinomycetota bacterium]
MRQILDGSPAWLLVLACFALFAAICAVARHLVRARTSQERRDELADYAGKLLGPLGATFAFLVGFAITMTWSALSAGQDAVDLQASSAQQVSWSSSNIADQAGAAQVQAKLVAYLEQATTSDVPALAEGEFTVLPSATSFDELQDAIHTVAYSGGNSVPEASGMVSAAASLTAARSKMVAVAQRSLPPLLIVLILLSGALLAVGMGISAATVNKPTLMYAWAFVAGLSLAMVLLLDFPFGGAIEVSLAPLQSVQQSIAS